MAHTARLAKCMSRIEFCQVSKWRWTTTHYTFQSCGRRANKDEFAKALLWQRLLLLWMQTIVAVIYNNHFVRFSPTCIALAHEIVADLKPLFETIFTLLQSKTNYLGNAVVQLRNSFQLNKLNVFLWTDVSFNYGDVLTKVLLPYLVSLMKCFIRGMGLWWNKDACTGLKSLDLTFLS